MEERIHLVTSDDGKAVENIASVSFSVVEGTSVRIDDVTDGTRVPVYSGGSAKTGYAVSVTAKTVGFVSVDEYSVSKNGGWRSSDVSFDISADEESSEARIFIAEEMYLGSDIGTPDSDAFPPYPIYLHAFFNVSGGRIPSHDGFRWFKDGILIGTTERPVLNMDYPSTSDSGMYHVEISDTASGNTLSSSEIPVIVCGHAIDIISGKNEYRRSISIKAIDAIPETMDIEGLSGVWKIDGEETEKHSDVFDIEYVIKGHSGTYSYETSLAGRKVKACSMMVDNPEGVGGLMDGLVTWHCFSDTYTGEFSTRNAVRYRHYPIRGDITLNTTAIANGDISSGRSLKDPYTGRNIGCLWFSGETAWSASSDSDVAGGRLPACKGGWTIAFVAEINPNKAPDDFGHFVSWEGNSGPQIYYRKSTNEVHIGKVTSIWSTGYILPNYQPFHLAITDDGTGNMTLYFNGEIVKTTKITEPSWTTDWGFSIGSVKKSTNMCGTNLAGKIGNVGTWSRCLSQSEIAMLYRSCDGNLVYPFDDAEGPVDRPSFFEGIDIKVTSKTGPVPTSGCESFTREDVMSENPSLADACAHGYTDPISGTEIPGHWEIVPPGMKHVLRNGNSDSIVFEFFPDDVSERRRFFVEDIEYINRHDADSNMILIDDDDLFLVEKD